MDRVIDELIVDEQRDHNLIVSALIQYLAVKGLINMDEFSQYLDEFSHEYIKKLYPELFSKCSD